MAVAPETAPRITVVAAAAHGHERRGQSAAPIDLVPTESFRRAASRVSDASAVSLVPGGVPGSDVAAWPTIADDSEVSPGGSRRATVTSPGTAGPRSKMAMTSKGRKMWMDLKAAVAVANAIGSGPPSTGPESPGGLARTGSRAIFVSENPGGLESEVCEQQQQLRACV